MKHNGRPPITATSLAPANINLYPGEKPSAACPDCGRWRFIRRHMLWPHRTEDGKSRCPGSGQRIIIDLTPEQWLDLANGVNKEGPKSIRAVSGGLPGLGKKR